MKKRVKTIMEMIFQPRFLKATIFALLLIHNVSVYGVILTPVSDAIDYSQPIVLKIQNNTPVDISPLVMIQHNLSPEDLNRLQSSTLYAHSEKRYSLNRTGYPVKLLVMFQVALNETQYRSYAVARWEYAENDAQVNVCHTTEGSKPYALGCAGNDDLTSPELTLTLTYQEPPKDIPANDLPSP